MHVKRGDRKTFDYLKNMMVERYKKLHGNYLKNVSWNDEMKFIQNVREIGKYGKNFET